MNDRLDPLDTARQIESSYKRYLKTLLAPRDQALATAFDAEIDSSTMLTKGPILELTPPYETGSTSRQLIDDGVLHSDFARLDSQAFSLNQPLYVHQETAIRKFVSGRNLVVSTGAAHRYRVRQDGELPDPHHQLAAGRIGKRDTRPRSQGTAPLSDERLG